MSGVGSIYNIAKSALAVQRMGMEVTAHNLANVDTEGYSRQRTVVVSNQPLVQGGVFVGRGVNVDEVSRVTDGFIEGQLTQQRSKLSSSGETEKYMQVLEALFNETSDNSISAGLAEYWNLWQDVSNNPDGAPERIALFEHATLLSNQFNALNQDLVQLQNDLSGSLDDMLSQVNQLTSQIADINAKIVSLESNNTANDLRDQRNILMSELSEIIDVKGFEQERGDMTIISARGAVLVQGKINFELQLGGSGGDRVVWTGSGGAEMDLTNHINQGSLGGLLDMRDEVIEKYRRDLDEVASEFIWSVNQQHSQGIGLNANSTMTGTHAASDTTEEMGTSDSGLEYQDKIVDGTFKLWVYDASGAVVGGGATTVTIDADAGGTTLSGLQSTIDGVANISASITVNNTLKIDAAGGYSFAFSDDTSNTLGALGLNTFFSGAGAGAITVNNAITLDKNKMAAAQIDSSGDFASGDNTNALAIADLQYTSQTISQWNVDRVNGNTEGSTTTTIEGYFHGMAGSIGIASASASRTNTFNKEMLKTLSERRDNISAVSLDEEMTNLVKYQSAYNAAAKLINASNEMLDILMNLAG
jgi:flagellar hook-associated protein 1